MWQYNYDYYDLAPDELMHYGKLGMKWGVIHNPAKAYAKAVNKRNSLNSKSDKNRIAYEKAKIKANTGVSAKYKKYQAKADKMHYKSSKALDKMYKHANPLIRTSISDDLYQRSRRKADKYQAKFMKSQRKANKYKSTYENRAAKAGAAESKYLRSKHKAEKWQEAIDKSFRNVDVNSLPIQYTSAGKAYIEKLKNAE